MANHLGLVNRLLHSTRHWRRPLASPSWYGQGRQFPARNLTVPGTGECPLPPSTGSALARRILNARQCSPPATGGSAAVAARIIARHLDALRRAQARAHGAGLAPQGSMPPGAWRHGDALPSFAAAAAAISRAAFGGPFPALGAQARHLMARLWSGGRHLAAGRCFGGAPALGQPPVSRLLGAGGGAAVVRWRTPIRRPPLHATPRRHIYDHRLGFLTNRQSGGGRATELGPDEILWGLIGANLAVFAAWQVVDPGFMVRNFTVSVMGLEKGRVWTAVTSTFSQKDFSHLLSNMIGLYFFGSEIAKMFGGRYLLGLYLAGGVAGSLSHYLYYKYVVPARQGPGSRWYDALRSPPALGASGAVNGIVLLDCLLFPTRIIYLNLIIPVPGLLLGLFFIFKDTVGAISGGQSNIGHAAHLGGAFVGAMAWARLRFRRFG